MSEPIQRPKKVELFPTTLGECIDLAYKAKKERINYEKAMEEKVKLLKEKEKLIEEHILATFKKGDIEGAKGRFATAGVTRLVVADVKDWDKFFKWVAKTDSWDMLRRQANDKAYRERLDNKVVIPGVKPFTKTKLSLTKR